MNWHSTKAAQCAETVSRVMACAAIFSIVLPTAIPNIFLALFLISSIIAGNYKFKYQLILSNSIAIIATGIFLLFVFGLLYTSAPIDDAQGMLKKYSKFIYIPLLLSAFYEERWKRYGYLAFLSGVSLTLLFSYMTLLGWSPESIYSGTYAGRDPHIIFRSRIAHGTLMAYAAYLFIHHAVDNKRMRILFIALAVLASLNVLIMVASRSGQIIWVALMLLLIYQYFDWKRVALGLMIVPTLALAILLSSDLNRTRVTELYKDIELIREGNYATSLGVRVICAQAGWGIFRRNPILGTGTGSFDIEFRKYTQTREIKNVEYYYTKNPHNGFVSVGVQLGLAGLVLLIALFAQQWRISNKLPLLTNHMAKGMIVTVVIGNLLNSVIYSHTQGIFFAMLTALFFSSCHLQKSNSINSS